MFRLKITIALLGSLLISAIGVSLLLDEIEDKAETRLETEVKGSYQAYDQLKALRDLRMKDIARVIAQSDLSAYLGVLQDYRKQMLAIEAEVYAAVPGAVNDEEAKDARAQWVADNKGAFLDKISEELTARIERLRGTNAWLDRPRDEVKADLRKSFNFCNAYAVNNCVHRLSFAPLSDVTRSIRNRRDRYGLSPDKVIVADYRGTGIADVDRPRWSDVSELGSDHPLVTEVKTGNILRDIIKFEDTYHFATAAPIFEGGKFRGSVLVGVAVTDAMAKRELRILQRHVMYLDDKATVAVSTPQWANEVRHNLIPRTDPPQVMNVVTEGLIAQFVPLTGNLTNQRFRVVLSADKTSALGAVGAMRTWVWVGALALAIITLLLLVRFHFVFMQPYVKLDQGMHEVADGDTDYVFQATGHEQLWGHLANKLNMVVGTLTGREYEDEAAVGETWSEDLIDGDTTGSGEPPSESPST